VLANNSASDAKLKSEDLVKALAGVTNVESVNIVTDLPNDTAITLNSGSTGMANLALDVLGSKLAGLTTDISGKLNIKVNGSVDALTAANAKSVNVDAVGAVTLTDTKAATNVNVKAAGDVTLTDTEAASSISVDANGAGKVTLTKATNVENLSVKNATNLTITAGGDKLNTVTLENVTLGDSSSAAAAIDFKGATTLNFNNVKMIDGSDSKIAHIKSSAETLNLNFSGKEATFALVTNQVTKVANITANADSNNFLITKEDGDHRDHAALANDSFTTFVIKGNGKELVFDAGDLDKVTSIDASGFNGNAKIVFGDSNGDAIAGLKVSSGAGNDTLVLESNKLSAGSVIDGGAGRDTIVLKSSALADSATLGMIKNIEVVQVDKLTANTNISTSAFDTIIVAGDETGSDTKLTINKDQKIDLAATTLAASKKITMDLNEKSGDNDSINLVLNAKTADNNVTVGNGGEDKQLVIETGIESVNITSVAKDSTTANSIDGKFTDVKSIIINGDAGITLKGFIVATDYKNVSMIDASALKAGLTFDASAITLGANATIKGGSGADSITVKGGNIVVDLVAGGDDTITLKKGAEKTDITTVNNFNAGDKIDIADAKNGTFTFNKITMNSDANLDDYITKAVAGDGSTNSAVSYFHHNGYTYVVVDGTAGATFTKATDTIIKLSGTLDLKLSGDNVVVDDGSVI
ncbi:beta strand repeat-containing protein, partial [Campylobacter fetus]|uniref:beta strand repeat-containing protein n=1 Tax=Campylobacter fetus TaxID=196 RepID=UPI003AF452B8